MRLVLVTALIAVLSGAGMSVPAAASGSDELVREDAYERTVIWTDRGPQFVRHRVARATINDADEDYEARTRRSYQSGDEDRPRYTKRRNTHTAKRSRRHHRAARRSTRRAAHHHAARRSTRKSAHRHAARRSTRRSAQLPSRRSHRADRRTTAARRGGWGGGEMRGIASYYWQGQRVATGARFNPEGLTAAHRTLPFGTRVRVTHLGNGRSVNVVINDRGPFIAGRIIDLARGAARVIGMTSQGLARVRVTVLSR